MWAYLGGMGNGAGWPIWLAPRATRILPRFLPRCGAATRPNILHLGGGASARNPVRMLLEWSSLPWWWLASGAVLVLTPARGVWIHRLVDLRKPLSMAHALSESRA